MTNTLTYRGYSARVEIDARDNLFAGHVLGVRDRITFHGETVAELRRDFEASVDHYLADCERAGQAPERPASGRLLLRIPPQVHAAAARRAEEAGQSLNQWAAEVIAEAAKA
jgi:predicted HicB family RNase H-like nuclease